MVPFRPFYKGRRRPLKGECSGLPFILIHCHGRGRKKKRRGRARAGPFHFLRPRGGGGGIGREKMTSLSPLPFSPGRKGKEEKKRKHVPGILLPCESGRGGERNRVERPGTLRSHQGEKRGEKAPPSGPLTFPVKAAGRREEG